MQTIHPVPDDIGSQIQTGDYVRVTTHNDELMEFEVFEVGNEQLIGKDYTVAYVEIAQIEVKRYDEMKTVKAIWWTGGGIFLGFLLLAGIIASGFVSGS